MSSAADQLEGGCLCGAVRFIATGQPKGVYWCHCHSCRKHSGAPASVYVAFERAAYTVTKGEIAKFDSHPGENPAGILRQVWINIDLRKRAAGDRNAFPGRRIR